MSETEAITVAPRIKRQIPLAVRRALSPVHMKATKEFGLRRFVHFISCCISDPKAHEFIEKWRRLSRHHGVRLDDVAYKMQIPAEKLYAWASEGAERQTRMLATMKQSIASPRVVNKNIEMALTDKGFKDRNLFFESTGIKPLASGTRIQVNQSNVNTANAAAKSDTSLPAFDSQRREIAEAVRADE